MDQLFKRLPIFFFILALPVMLLLVLARPLQSAAGNGTDLDNPYPRPAVLTQESSLQTHVAASGHNCNIVSNPVSNCGFETGDFTGWITSDLSFPFVPLMVGGAGLSPGFGLFVSQPTEGTFAALHGFDGDGPGTIRLSQDITVPVDLSTLEFDYRAAWDLANFGATLSRTFAVVIEPAGGGAALQATPVLTAPVGTFVADTGNRHGLVDLSSFSGSAIRLSFEWNVPESSSGPAFFQLDNVLIKGPDLSLTKSAVAGINAGTPLSYTLNVAVTGFPTSTFSGIVLTDVLPAAVIQAAVSPSQGTCSGSGTVVCALGQLNGGETATVTIVTIPTIPGLITNTARVTANEPEPVMGNNVVTVTTAVALPMPGLYGSSTIAEIFTIDLTSGAGSLIGVIPGTGATEIEYDNLSDRAFVQDADGSFLGWEFDIETAAVVAGPFPNGGAYNGIEYISSVAYGTVITAPGGPSELRTIDLFAGSSALVGATGVGPISGLAYDSAADVLYGIAGGPGPAILYTLSLTSGVATPVGSTGIQAGSLQFGPDGALYAGGTGPDAGDLFRIEPTTAMTTFVGATGFSSVTGLTLVLIEPTDLGISKNVTPDPVQAGTLLTYSLNVTNSGPITASNVTVQDWLPIGATFISATPSQGACSESGGTVTCSLGTMANGGNAVITIVVTVDPTSRGNLTNTANVTADQVDDMPLNNTAVVTTSVIAAADLAVSKNDSSDPVKTGMPLTYTVLVENLGPAQATGVIMTDTLPAPVTLNTANASQGSCTDMMGSVICNLDSLDPGATVTVTLVVTATNAGSITNTVSVSSLESDPDLMNNVADEMTVITMEIYLPLVMKSSP